MFSPQKCDIPYPKINQDNKLMNWWGWGGGGGEGATISLIVEIFIYYPNLVILQF